MSAIGEGFANAGLMAWQVCWALVLGFVISATVQAWAPRERVQRALGGEGARPVALATALGAASSSCSYAAIAIAKSLFERGASAASALAFQFASTNLVVELGVVIAVLIGWQFALAELVGGLMLVVVMTVLLRAFVPRATEADARRHAGHADAAHVHHAAQAQGSLGVLIRSRQAWSDVAHNFHNDVAMVWKEILGGFLIAGFLGLIHDSFWTSLFLRHAPALPRLLENVVIGPVIAILSFVCSVGNVPLAAVLWSGGIGFGGVIAFVFADLLVLPILLIYRRYYGLGYAARISALMFVTIVVAALAVDGLFSLAGLIPATRPSHAEVFGHITVGFDLFANAIALAAIVALFGLTARRGATDPVCGMQVDRRRALSLQTGSDTQYFCSEGCRERFRAA